MRFVGIDVAAERHVVAVVDETDRVILKATPFTEDAEGYAKLLGLLGAPSDALVAMEATGHYWKNLFAALVAAGFAVALLNPLRTRRFAGEDLQRTQTDAIDAVGIARFAAQKRPPASRLPDGTTEELRELVRFRDRLRQDFGDRVRQLHRLVDLGFPEFSGVSSLPRCCGPIPPRPAFTASRCVAWPPSATTGATKLVRTSPPP
jgi:transposase